MSLGLTVFHKLCDVGNALQGLRDQQPPGSDSWVGLAELVLQIDSMIDMLVDSEGLEDARHAR